MKRLFFLTVLCVIVGAGPVYVEASPKGSMMKGSSAGTAAEAQNVGNTICPVSGEPVGSMEDAVKVEYNGKIYNLCCSMCKKTFLKDPEKYSQIAEAQAAALKAADPDDDDDAIKGSHHHKGSHHDH